MTEVKFKVTPIEAPAGSTSSQASKARSVRVDIVPLKPIRLTWKYVRGTPEWAVAAAEAMGYETELLD